MTAMEGAGDDSVLSYSSDDCTATSPPPTRGVPSSVVIAVSQEHATFNLKRSKSARTTGECTSEKRKKDTKRSYGSFVPTDVRWRRKIAPTTINSHEDDNILLTMSSHSSGSSPRKTQDMVEMSQEHSLRISPKNIRTEEQSPYFADTSKRYFPQERMRLFPPSEERERIPLQMPVSRSSLARKRRRARRQQEARERAIFNEIRGKEQDLSVCRDSFFAVLFIVQFLGVLFIAARFGSAVFSAHVTSIPRFFNMPIWLSRISQHELIPRLDLRLLETVGREDLLGNENEITSKDEQTHNATMTDGGANTSGFIQGLITHASEDYENIILLAIISGLYAAMQSALTIGFMFMLDKYFIAAALLFSIVISLAWGVMGLLVSPFTFIPVLGILALTFSGAYTVVVWDRIPFVATNLTTALCGLRSTPVVMFLGIAMLFVVFGWCIVWMVAFAGISIAVSTSEVHVDDGWLLLLYTYLIFSLCWTIQVLQNVVRATVSSIIGLWWYDPDAIHPCSSQPIFQALVRSLSTSLGSVCFGSLIEAPARLIGASMCALKMPNNRGQYHLSRSNSQSFDEDSDLDTGIETNGWTANTGVARFVNRWSVVYIGLYGYGFMDAGKKALELFETREWTGVVSDSLVHNVIFMASTVIAVSAGTFGFIIEEIDGYTFLSFPCPSTTAFLIGSTMGFILCHVLMSVVSSAFNTVLVCFAAGPYEFQEKHNRLSDEMRSAWSQFWADSALCGDYSYRGAPPLDHGGIA